MNNTTKVGLMAAMLVLGLVAFSGSANAFYVQGTGGGACNGSIDDHCVCKSNQANCVEGETCTYYVQGNCVYG